MTATRYSDLLPHIGHDIECVAYGSVDDPENVAVECHDCNVVLLDYDRPLKSDDEVTES